jgi:integrase
MSGSIHQYKGAWFVAWYDKETRKTKKIYRYKGEKMYHKKTAQKLLSIMQSDVENGTFYLERYTTKGFTDVVQFIDQWLTGVKDEISPATYDGYRSYVKRHIRPYFVEHHTLSLHDIQLDVLKDIKSKLPLGPKGKMNVMYCIHVILDEAKRSRRIISMPSFPKRKEYQLEQKAIQWLPEVRQLNVIEQIPEDHQPIFYFLKYHLRRPAEACALHKEDLEDGVFTIRRSISSEKLVNKTKTGEIHTIPCHPNFEPLIEIERQKQVRLGIISPFMFVNPVAWSTGKRYTNKSLNAIWKKACKAADENIDLYSGLKHSSCSQYINEKGLHESELQIITDHANLGSVRRYAKTEVKRKRELMMKNVFNLDSKRKGLNDGDS